jgi:hypothetical protein
LKNLSDISCAHQQKALQNIFESISDLSYSAYAEKIPVRDGCYQWLQHVVKKYRSRLARCHFSLCIHWRCRLSKYLLLDAASVYWLLQLSGHCIQTTTDAWQLHDIDVHQHELTARYCVYIG